LVWIPSVSRASAPNVEYAGFAAPDGCSRPLCHGLPELSRKVNQTNICTFGSLRAKSSACFAYLACVARVTPFRSPGFVSWPYSVIQTGTVRWYHLCRSFSKRGSDERVTFG
jgi:hypothetical protein